MANYAVLSCYLVSFEQLPRAGMRISNRDAIRRGPHGHACVGRERRTAILMTRYYCKHFKAAPLRRCAAAGAAAASSRVESAREGRGGVRRAESARDTESAAPAERGRAALWCVLRGLSAARIVPVPVAGPDTRQRRLRGEGVHTIHTSSDITPSRPCHGTPQREVREEYRIQYLDS